MKSLCRRYGVSAAGYYAWRRRPESAHAEQNRQLISRIKRIFQAHSGRYGSPRVHRALKEEGISVSRRRVARLMQLLGLRAKAVRGYRSKAALHRFYDRQPNLVRGSSATRPDQVWVGDITYLPVAGRWWYLAVVMDQYSRRVLAWSLTPRRDATVTTGVLRAALRARRARGAPPGLIFHSDRGSEYLAAPFRSCVEELGLVQSASTRGPEDNAHVESFFHSLKAELTRGVHFSNARELRRQLRRYIRYYNKVRMHSALEYHSPIAFEARAA